MRLSMGSDVTAPAALCEAELDGDGDRDAMAAVYRRKCDEFVREFGRRWLKGNKSRPQRGKCDCNNNDVPRDVIRARGRSDVDDDAREVVPRRRGGAATA